MNLRACHLVRSRQRGSVLIIVLWVALGLVAITLYFASSMSFELRASDNRVSALAADQAIEGAARYVIAVLASQGTNGTVPDVASYQSQAVPVGESHFWLIGRSVTYQVQPDSVFFGLVDEASKLNLNTVSADSLGLLTNMYAEVAANIVDWRSTNGTTSASGDGPTVYSQFQQAYIAKGAPFETVDELRLIYPMDLGTLVGEDINRNAALDPSETDTNRNGAADCGLLEYVTVYSREPNSGRVDVSNLTSASSQLQTMLATNLTASRVNQIMLQLGLASPPTRGNNGRGGTVTAQIPVPPIASPLAFYRASGMTSDEFATIANFITVTNGTYIQGRVNINTASSAVLVCLPGMTSDLAQQLVAYREQNTDRLTSIAWVVDALGQNNASALATLQAGDYITTQSYQFSADVAALGPYGRGYKRVKFIFDTTSGTPQIIYRQDLTHLGWALGKNVRQDWLLANNTR